MKKTIQWYEKKGKGSYFDPELIHFISTVTGFDDELLFAKEATPLPLFESKQKGMKERQFWISIKKAKDCFFSRRNGYVGKIICGYSVVIRLFGHDLLKDK